MLFIRAVQWPKGYGASLVFALCKPKPTSSAGLRGGAPGNKLADSVAGATARLGGRAPRRPAEPRVAAPRAVGARAVAAWWRARVVAPARRAWLAVVAAHLRGRRDKARAESAGIVDLHRDVQTCGYHDVQVMWGMLGLEATGTPAAPERRNRSPPFWYFLPWRRAAAAPSAARAGASA